MSLVTGAAFDAVVDVDVRRGAEAFVVEGQGTGRFFQLFRELVDRTEVVGGSGNLEAAGLKELLVAAVEYPGDFAVEQPSGTGEDLDLAVGRRGDLGGAAVFAHFEGVGRALCTLLGWSHIESL